MSSTDKQQTFNFRISNGLLEHYPTTGESIWLFIYLVDKQTKGVDKDRNGKVHYGLPVRDQDIAGTLRASRRTVIRMRKRLIKHSYNLAKRTKEGFIYTIPKPKKWKKNSEQQTDSKVTDVSHLSECLVTEKCDTFGQKCDTSAQKTAESRASKAVSRPTYKHTEGGDSIEGPQDRDEEASNPRLECSRAVKESMRRYWRRPTKSQNQTVRGGLIATPSYEHPA